MFLPRREELRPRVEYLLRLAGVFAAYFVAGRLGLAVPFTQTNVSPLWPPAGSALASVVLFGYSIWPAIAAGAFLVNFFSPIPHLTAVGIAIGNTSAALVGGYLLRRDRGFDPALMRLRGVMHFILLGAMASSIVSASNGVLVLRLARLHPWMGDLPAWLVWWLGDVLGVLIVAPLVLGMVTRRDLLRRRSLAEATLLLGATSAAAFVIFDQRVIF